LYNQFLKNKLLKETFWSFLSKGSAFVLFLVFNVFLSRTLGVENFGKWSFYFSIISIISVLSYFGINNASNKFIAQFNKTIFIKDVINSSIKIRFFISLIFSVVFLIFSQIILINYGNLEMKRFFLCATPFIFLSGFVEYLKSVFSGLHRIKFNFIITILEYGFKLIFILFLVILSTKLWVVMGSLVLSLFITSLIGLYLLYNFFYNSLKQTGKDFKKKILQYSYPLLIISLGSLALTEIDTVMIGLLSSSYEVGVYAIAKQIILKLPHISFAIALGTMPIFAKITEENKEELKKKFLKIIKINALIFTIVCVLLVFLSPFFIPLIFGVAYKASVLPLQILSIYLFFLASSIILNNFLDYSGKAKKRAIHMSITLCFNVLLNLILIPKYGSVGAAISTTISYTPYVILNWIEVKKVLR
jgi:O-antigen/teichoic acid export membrane protein